MKVIHTIEPFFESDSEILILGSFPSVTSRTYGFYYAHPQNRFWQVLSKVYNYDIKEDVNSKKEFLRKHKIALYDVCATCSIKGSSDSSIKEVVPNDIAFILKSSNVKKIFTTGKTAYNLYNKYLKNTLDREAIYLPSSSSANAAFNIEKLVSCYQVLKNQE